MSIDAAHVQCNLLIIATEEDHNMRFFFPCELELFLSQTGFCLERLGAFPEIDREPGEDLWNILAVARLLD